MQKKVKSGEERVKREQRVDEGGNATISFQNGG
jgi:hypothetical protein